MAQGRCVIVGGGFLVAFVAAVIFAGGKAHPGELPSFYHAWLLSKVAAYAVSALPYVGIAILLHAAPAVQLNTKGGFALAVTGLVVNHFAGVSTPLSMLISACGALVFGLALPPVRLPALVQNASRAAYGIYLSHMLVLFLVGKIAKRFGVYPDHLASLLGMAIATFLGAWAVSAVIERNDVLRWLLLGAPREKRGQTSTTSVGPVPTVAPPALQTA